MMEIRMKKTYIIEIEESELFKLLDTLRNVSEASAVGAMVSDHGAGHWYDKIQEMMRRCE